MTAGAGKAATRVSRHRSATPCNCLRLAAWWWRGWNAAAANTEPQHGPSGRAPRGMAVQHGDRRRRPSALGDGLGNSFVHMIHRGYDHTLLPVLRSCLLLAALLGGPAAYAQAPAEAGPAPSPGRSAPATPPNPRPLPADVTTHHTLELPGQPSGRTLHFSATAGAIRLVDDKGAPRADVAFIAYQARRRRGAQPQGDLRHEWRPGLRVGLAAGRRGGALADPARGSSGGSFGESNAGWGGRAVRVAAAAAQRRDLAGFHRPCVHRSGRHRLFARAHHATRTRASRCSR